MTTDALLTAEFRQPPWKHQLKEFEQHVETPARALLWQMRTGKTKLIIDTACHLFKAGKVEVCIVFAPNGVHRNWCERELPAHTWLSVPHETHLWQASEIHKASNRAIRHMTSALNANRMRIINLVKRVYRDKMQKIYETEKLLWFFFNSESLVREDVKGVIARLTRKKKCMLVWDESTDFRSPGSKRTKMMRAIARHAAYRRILDGTPITNSPFHAFSQFELLEKSALGFVTSAEFKDRYGVWEKPKYGRGMRFKEYQNLDELRTRMAPLSSVVLRSDCEDLPGTIPRIRRVELTDNQKQMYRQLLNRESLTGIEVEKHFIKLQQILSGFIIDEAGETHTIPGGNPKLNALCDEIDIIPGKIIVWCQFQHDIDLVARMLAPGSYVEYHGRISAANKVTNLKAFLTNPRKRVFVSQVQSAGRGLNLSVADTIIWYSHTFDAILRQQATERATEMGGNTISVIDLVAPGIDEYILSVVQRKVTIAEDVAGRGLQKILDELTI